MLNAVPPTRGAVRALFGQIGLKQAVAAGRVSDEMVDWYHALLRDTPTVRQRAGRHGAAAVADRGPRPRADRSDRELLGRIEAPTFFLWGDGDPFGGAEVAQALVADVPGAELELLPGAGHAVWMDDADHVANATRRFLDPHGSPDDAVSRRGGGRCGCGCCQGR